MRVSCTASFANPSLKSAFWPRCVDRHFRFVHFRCVFRLQRPLRADHGAARLRVLPTGDLHRQPPHVLRVLHHHEGACVGLGVRACVVSKKGNADLYPQGESFCTTVFHV